VQCNGLRRRGQRARGGEGEERPVESNENLTERVIVAPKLI
jgi:hypothetical protein